MIKHYVRITLRNLMRQRLHALINIIGLATGIACAVLLFLLIRHETSFDRFHEHSDHLYRAWIHEDHGGDQQFTDVTTPLILAQTLKDNVAAIENAARVNTYTEVLRYEGRAFEQRVHLVDPAFLSVFSFSWLSGDSATALNQPNSIVLTPLLAEKYFGAADPLGKSLELRVNDVYQPYIVTGLIAPPPLASSIQYEAIIPHNDAYYNQSRLNSWFNISSAETYVLLRPGTDPTALEVQLEAMMKRILGDRYPTGHYLIHLQPMPAIHLDSSIPAGREPTGNPVTVWFLGAVTLLLLIVASINFVTLSIGRSTLRALEVGLRKVVGARRSQLMQQFWVETLVTTLLALVIGLVLAELTLPLFNNMSGAALLLAPDAELTVMLIAVLVLVGLGAGSYPAAILSGFRPVEALKGNVSVRSDRNLLRRGLVVFQFALAIVMITSTLVMSQQLDFLLNKDLGFSPEDIVVIPLPGSASEGERLAPLFDNEAETLAGFSSITAAAFPPGAGQMLVGYTDDQNTFREFNVNIVKPDFVSAMGMEIVAGRDFSTAIPTDRTQGIIINEAFANEYGWENPVGQKLPGAEFPEHAVIGVVKDFNFMSLQEDVGAMMLVLDMAPLEGGLSDTTTRSSPTLDMLVRLDTVDQETALAALETIWQRILPDVPFNYYFLEDSLNTQYQPQLRLERIVKYSTVLTLFIACLGLFGLAILAAGSRTKEIGVRKVMGGSVWSIVLLLTNDFSKLVLIANVIAWPVAYFAMNRWLENFAYRIDLTPLLFIGSGLIALCIAWVTVGGTAAKAASAKPVLALRYE